MGQRAKPEPADTSALPTLGERAPWLVGGGELGGRIRDRDWSGTPLGPPESWPASLRTAANLLVSLASPAGLAWGERSTLLYNDAYRDLLGASHPAALGASFDETWLTAVPELTLPFRQAVGGAAAAAEKPLPVVGHGTPALFSHAFTPVRDERGALTGVLHGVTELRPESSDRARVANAELEAFSYSVSHDLRAPLRAIDGFTQALQSDYASKLDDEGRRYLDRVRNATQRMAQLIDDLLSLSRLSRMVISLGPANLTEISRRILAGLARRDPERRVDIQVADDLTARADSRLLAELLGNLLENAWKFTSHTETARIEVGSGRRDGQAVFFVRDNGAGFEMQYAGKLFAPFQRLHPAKDYPGTGIGLAKASRVVGLHGGRIWAEASPGRGAAFYFTLAEGT